MTGGMKSRLIFRLTKIAVKGMLMMRVRVSVEGLRHVSACGPAILVANHRSMFDGPLLYSLTRTMVYSFIKEEYFSHPLVRWYLRGGGGIPIQSGALRLSMIKEAHEVLRKGNMLLLFPEGRIGVDATIETFRPAFVKLAMTQQVPIVPISIIGSEQAFPNAEWRWIPRRANIRIVVHQPVRCPSRTMGRDGIEDTVEAVRQIIVRTWSDHSCAGIATNMVAARMTMPRRSDQSKEVRDVMA